jgi:hypothetical protein
LKAVTREGSSPYDFSPCDFIADLMQEMALRRLSLAEEAEK